MSRGSGECGNNKNKYLLYSFIVYVKGSAKITVRDMRGVAKRVFVREDRIFEVIEKLCKNFPSGAINI